jgi:hypothetical protein
VAALPQRLAQPARGVARLRGGGVVLDRDALGCAAAAAASATSSAVVVRAVLITALEADLGLSLMSRRVSSTRCGILS